MSESVTRLDEAEQAATASIQKRVEYYEGRNENDDKRDRDDSRGSAGGEGSHREPKRKCSQKEKELGTFCSAGNEKTVWTLNEWLSRLFRLALF